MEAPFRHIYDQTYGDNLAATTLRAMRMYFIVVGPLTSAGVVVIRSLIFSFLLVMLVKGVAVTENFTFAQIYAYIIHCEMVFLLMNMLTVLILTLQGIAAIRVPADLIVFKGLEAFIDGEHLGSEGLRIFSNINVFTLWYLAISSVGLKIITELDRSTAFLITVAAWLLWMLLDIVRDHIASLAVGGLL